MEKLRIHIASALCKKPVSLKLQFINNALAILMFDEQLFNLKINIKIYTQQNQTTKMQITFEFNSKIIPQNTISKSKTAKIKTKIFIKKIINDNANKRIELLQQK